MAIEDRSDEEDEDYDFDDDDEDFEGYFLIFIISSFLLFSGCSVLVVNMRVLFRSFLENTENRKLTFLFYKYHF